MTTTTGNILNSTNDVFLSEPLCQAEGSKWLYIVLMPLPLLSGIVNVIVFLAASIYRSKLLRHNYVYFCVTSTLFSHLLFLALHLWDEISSYRINPKISSSPPAGRMKVLWSLCQSGAVAMLFGMCCNLGALIFVMIDSSHFQIASKMSDLPENQTKSGFMHAKKIKAVVLVVLSWLLPLVLTIIAVLWLNCADRCRCSPGASGEACPRDSGCSAVWAPLTISFMSINIVLWFCEVAGLAILLTIGVRNFQKFTSGSKTRTNGFPKTVDGSLANQNLGNMPESAGSMEDVEEIAVVQPLPIVKASRWSWFRRNPRLRCAVVLSLIFVLCTLPIVIVFFFDLSQIPFEISAARVTALVLVHLYTLICPILLVTYLSNLRTAVVQMLTDLLCCF